MVDFPKVGDTIYVPTSLYLGHGRDDFIGGRAVIRKVTAGKSAGKPTPFVSVWARPRCEYNWELLSGEQEKLAQEYGDGIAHPNPDYSPEFNDW